MGPEDHGRLVELFRQACDMQTSHRAAFLEESCRERPDLRDELERLLANDEGGEIPPISGDSPDTARLSERIGKFRLIRLLGQGGMGLVYLAEQDSPKRVVALKVLAPGLATPKVLARFALEADALARLQHPHIAQIFDSGTIESPQGVQPYLAMEFVEGASLLDYARAKELDDSKRLQLMTQLCDAVHHAHQKGVIHRDLKPANILVTAGNDVKVLDFGVARIADVEVPRTSLRTHAGDLIGTIPYMSPEQASGHARDLDTRSDVYALGVIAYELLSGSLPYDLTQRMIHEAIDVVRNQVPKPLSSIVPRLHGDIETIVGKALEKSPDRRYQSAHEMASDIRRFLDQQPIMARPPSVIYQVRMFARRHGFLVGSAVTILGVLLASAIIMSWLSIRLMGERDESMAQRRRADEALQTAQKSLSAQTAIAGFLQDVFAAGSPYVGKHDMTVAEALDLAASRVAEKFAEDPEGALAVRMRLSDTYFSQGRVEASIEQLEAALKLTEGAAKHEVHFSEKVMVLASLGQLYLQAGKVDAARAHLIKAMSLTESPTRKDDPVRALVLVNYGALLLEEKKSQEAIPMFQQALELRLKEFGPDHPYTMTLRNNLAVATADAGRWEESELLSRENVESHLRALGEKHPNTITGIYNLADLLRERGKLAESDVLFQRCLKLAIEHLPTRHFSVGNFHSGYGEMLRMAGRFGEGEAELKLAHEILSEQLANDHALTLRARQRLAQLYVDWSRPDEAAKWKVVEPQEVP